MTPRKRPWYATGPLDDLMHVADEFWFIKKRPRLLKAFQFLIGGPAVVFFGDFSCGSHGVSRFAILLLARIAFFVKSLYTYRQ